MLFLFGTLRLVVLINIIPFSYFNQRNHSFVTISCYFYQQDCELISELRSPKDIVSRPIDIDWAASDRPVIATADGCIR